MLQTSSKILQEFREFERGIGVKNEEGKRCIYRLQEVHPHANLENFRREKLIWEIKMKG